MLCILSLDLQTAMSTDKDLPEFSFLLKGLFLSSTHSSTSSSDNKSLSYILPSVPVVASDLVPFLCCSPVP